MHPALWLVAALCAAPATTGTTVSDPHDSLVLTVDEAVEHALAHNAQLQVAAAQAKAAEEHAISAGRRDPIRFSLNPATILEQAGAFVGDVLGLSNKRKYASRVARNELAAVLASNAEFELELVASVRAGYWAVALGAERLEALAREVERVQLVHDHAIARFEAGVTDMTPAELAAGDMAVKRAQYTEAALSLDSHRAQLCLLLGVDSRTPLELTSVPESLDLGVPAASELARLAETKRPAMACIGALVRSAEASIGLARAERRPDVTLGAAFEELELFGFADIEFPLLDFGSIRHNIRATEAERAAAEAELEVLRQDLAVEMVDARNRLQATRESLNAAAVFAQHTARLALADRQRADAGLATADEVLAAESEADAARAAHLEAQLDHQVAIAALERAVGLPLDEFANALEALDAPVDEENENAN